MPGTKHVEAIIVVRKPTAGRMTRTGEDAAGKNAQTQISARQPVISSVQRITPDSDGTRAQVAGPKFPNTANFKRVSRTQILKYNTLANLVIGGRSKFHRTSRRFSAPPTLRAETTPGKVRSRMGGTANYLLDPRAWCLFLVVVPFPSINWLVTRVWAKAHHVPRCAAQSLTPFPLLSKDTPTNPLPGTVLAGPLVGLRFVEQFQYSETAVSIQ